MVWKKKLSIKIKTHTQNIPKSGKCKNNYNCKRKKKSKKQKAKRKKHIAKRRKHKAKRKKKLKFSTSNASRR